MLSKLVNSVGKTMTSITLGKIVFTVLIATAFTKKAVIGDTVLSKNCYDPSGHLFYFK